ncbi:MAG: S41 family peptidase [Actinobacteria bacterium]|nr:S41 family peptidase [Actinomycetota bacterium]
MKSKKIFLVLIAVIPVLTLVLGFGIGLILSERAGFKIPWVSPSTEESSTATDSFKVIGEAADYIYKQYVSEVSKESLKVAAINGMLESLNDEHAFYYSAKDLNMLLEDLHGNVVGVGIWVLQKEGKVVVVAPIKDTPAFEAGIEPGDQITAVDGTNIEGMDIDKVISMIRGEEGTEVKLTIVKETTKKVVDLTLTRKKFKVPNTESKMIGEDVGYIRYFAFDIGGAQEFVKEFDLLKDKGAKGLIIDLRQNFGGSVDDAVAMGRLFIKSGKIVSLKTRGKLVESYSGNGTGDESFPLVILVNRYSASASELFAGAIQDNNRGVLVGEVTFGKGSVQVILDLSDRSGFKMTSALYYLPSDRSIDKVGITPDVSVSQDSNMEEDAVLDKGVEVLNGLISGKKVTDFKQAK